MRSYNIQNFLIILLILSLSSCRIISKSEYQSLIAENDSLRMAQEMMMDGINAYFDELNQLQTDIDSINMVGLDIRSGGVERHRSTIDEARDKIKKSQIRIKELEERLINSNLQIEGLRESLAIMNARYEQAEIRISQLDKELSRSKAKITRQSKVISAQSQMIQRQEQEIVDKKMEIATAQEEVARAQNRVYYIMDTKSILKSKNILSDNLAARPTGSGHEYFVEIDKREVSYLHIPYKIFEIKSKHPKNTYIISGTSGDYYLKVTDIDRFWSTPYLIIAVR